jgi:hypothetical protein
MLMNENSQLILIPLGPKLDTKNNKVLNHSQIILLAQISGNTIEQGL